MKQTLAYVADCLRFVVGDTATITILVAVSCVSFFAFVLGAEAELVYGLLSIGLLTAVIEARLHVRAERDKSDASR
jgi:hypothetical protein